MKMILFIVWRYELDISGSVMIVTLFIHKVLLKVAISRCDHESKKENV
jgi:hypothetical protein